MLVEEQSHLWQNMEERPRRQAKERIQSLTMHGITMQLQPQPS